MTDRIRLLGREMLTWSDALSLPGAVRGPVAGRLAGSLTQAASPARALVVGPHAAEVVRAVTARAGATEVLVRSLPDAQALREELPEEITVACGPLDRFEPEAPYDLVVALAGPDLLHSAEEASPGVEETVDRLAALVAEAGQLLLGLPNPLGLTSLLALEVGRGRRDHEWPSGRVADPGPSRAELVQGLAAAGLVQRQVWSCFGGVHDAALAVSEAALADRTADPLLGELAARAAQGASDSFARDPGQAVRQALRQGLGVHFASSWVGLFERGAPQALAAPVLARVDTELLELHPADTGWRAMGEPERALPSAPSLATQLAEALAAHDAAAAGELVRRYRDWLGDDAAADQAPLAPRDLLAGTDGLVPLVVAPGPELAPATALAAGLLAFSSDLVRAGGRHPWPDSSGDVALARQLLATAGVEADDELLAAARLVAVDSSPQQEPAHDVLVGELVDLRRQLGEADTQIRWLLRNIHIRERRVRAANRRVAQMRKSAEYRLGTKVLKGRGALGRLRARLRGAQPQDAGKPPRREWQDPATRATKGPVPLELDPDLVPPGYTVDGDTI